MKPILILILFFIVPCCKAQDSISGIDRNTNVSLIYKMLQGKWELVSDTNNKLSFKGKNAMSIYYNPYKKEYDTEKCKYVILFYDTAYDHYLESGGNQDHYPHKSYEYPGRESDYNLIHCDVDISPTDSYFIFGCCVFEGVYSIGKNYLRLWVGNSSKFKNGSRVFKRITK